MNTEITTQVNRLHGDVRELRELIEDEQENMRTTAHNAYQAAQRVERLEPQIPLLNTAVGNIFSGQQAIPNIIEIVDGRVQNIQHNIDRIRDTQALQNERLDIINEVLQAIDTKLTEQSHWYPSNPDRPFDRPNRADSESPELDFTNRQQSTRLPVPKNELPKGAKNKKPDAFSGKRGKEAEIFLMKMELYFDDYPGVFNDDQKIIATLSNMAEGSASNWAMPHLLNIKGAHTHPYVQLWNDFKEGFLLNFNDPIRKERAIREIAQLKQIGSAQKYATDFRTLKENLKWDDQALIDRFKAGLKTEVQKELMRAEITNPNQKLSLEEWIAFAIRTDDLLFTTRGITQTGQSNQNTGKRTETGKASSEVKKEDRVSSEEIQQRRDNKLCLKCGRSNHMVKDCRSQKWVTTPAIITGKQGTITEIDESESTSSESEN